MANKANKPKLGRPCSYTEQLGKRICDLVAERVAIVKICAMSDMPSKDTLYRWKREIPSFSDQFIRAREHRADARQDYIDEVLIMAQTGKLDYNTARLIIDTEKWQMSKEQPKYYGDRNSAPDLAGQPVTVNIVKFTPE